MLHYNLSVLLLGVTVNGSLSISALKKTFADVSEERKIKQEEMGIKQNMKTSANT